MGSSCPTPHNITLADPPSRASLHAVPLCTAINNSQILDQPMGDPHDAPSLLRGWLGFFVPSPNFGADSFTDKSSLLFAGGGKSNGKTNAGAGWMCLQEGICRGWKLQTVPGLYGPNPGNTCRHQISCVRMCASCMCMCMWGRDMWLPTWLLPGKVLNRDLRASGTAAVALPLMQSLCRPWRTPKKPRQGAERGGEELLLWPGSLPGPVAWWLRPYVTMGA